MPSAEVDDEPAEAPAYYPNRKSGGAADSEARITPMDVSDGPTSTAIVGKQEFGVVRHSNMAVTRREERIGALSSEAQAIKDLTPWFKEKGVEKHVRKVAKALVNNSHRTYGNAMEGLAAWKFANFEHYDNIMGGSLSLTVGDRGLITQAINAYKDYVEPPPVPTKLICRVRCNEIELKLTLTAKFLAKPLSDALLKPFLNAYSKKALKGSATLEDIKRVRLGEPGPPGHKIRDFSADVASLIVPHHKYLSQKLSDGSPTCLLLVIKLIKKEGDEADDDEEDEKQKAAADGDDQEQPAETEEAREARQAAEAKAKEQRAKEEQRRQAKLAADLLKAEEAQATAEAEAALAARPVPEDALSALDLGDEDIRGL